MGFIRTSVPSPLDLSSSSESLLLSQPHVELFLSASRTLGRGTLHITTKRVLWLPDDAQPAGSGYSVDFPQLLMHALSRDTAYFPHPAIYCQLEQDEEGEGEDADEDDADGDDAEADDASAGEGGRDELTAAAEVRLVPDDEAARQLNGTEARMHAASCPPRFRHSYSRCCCCCRAVAEQLTRCTPS